MGKFYETMPASLMPWLRAQHCFWVASAPLSAHGHVNVSPKGGPYFGVADERTFWYLDLTGSGVETISHLHEPGNGRVTVLFNAFTGGPRIVRLWGHGRVLEYGTRDFESFVAQHGVNTIAGTRAIIVVDVHQVGTSCGMSMPYYDFRDYRLSLNQFFERKVAAEDAGNKAEGIERYWAFKNAESIDKMPGLKRGVANSRRDSVSPMPKMVGPYAPTASRKTAMQEPLRLLLVALLAFAMGAYFTLVVQKRYRQRDLRV